MLKNLFIWGLVTLTSISLYAQDNCFKLEDKDYFDKWENKGNEMFGKVLLDSAYTCYDMARISGLAYQICLNSKGKTYYSIVVTKMESVKMMKKGITKMQTCQYDSAQIYFSKVIGFEGFTPKTDNYFKLNHTLIAAKRLDDSLFTEQAADSLKNIEKLATDSLSRCIKSFKKDIEVRAETTKRLLESAREAYNIGNLELALERLRVVKVQNPEISKFRQKVETLLKCRQWVQKDEYTEATQLIISLPDTADLRFKEEQKNIYSKRKQYIDHNIAAIKPRVEEKKYQDVFNLIDTIQRRTNWENAPNAKERIANIQMAISKIDSLDLQDCSFTFGIEKQILSESQDIYVTAKTAYTKILNLEADPFYYNKDYKLAIDRVRTRHYTEATLLFNSIEKHCKNDSTITKWQKGINTIEECNKLILAKKLVEAEKKLKALAGESETFRPSINVLLSNLYLQNGATQQLVLSDSLMSKAIITQRAYNYQNQYDKAKIENSQLVSDALIHSGLYLCATTGIYVPTIFPNSQDLSFAQPSLAISGYPLYYGGRLQFHGNRVLNFYLEGRYQKTGINAVNKTTNITTKYENTFLEIPAVLNIHTTGYEKGIITPKPYHGFYFCFPIGVVGRLRFKDEQSTTTSVVQQSDFAVAGTGGLGLEFAGKGGYFSLQGMGTYYFMPGIHYQNANYNYWYWNISATLGFRL